VTSFTLAALAASDADLAASAICANKALRVPVSMVVIIFHNLQVVDKEDERGEGLFSKVLEVQGAKQSTAVYSRMSR